MNVRNEPDCSRVSAMAIGVTVSITMLLFVLTSVSIISGCRTAASMGLPVSSGSHTLLPHASHVRQTVGHLSEVPAELSKQALPPHRVEAGDVLVIEPNDFNSPVRLQSDQTVQQDGIIELGEYGRLAVVGLTTEEIQQQVQARVAAREVDKRQTRIALASHRNAGSPVADEVVDYGVTVRLVNTENSVYYVMGEVNAPGSYPPIGSETVLDAIIAAGGLSDRANEHKIILTRPRHGEHPLILPVCYQQILQLGDVATNYQLHPGDRIYVPSLTLWEDIKQSVAWRSDKGCPSCRNYKR